MEEVGESGEDRDKWTSGGDQVGTHKDELEPQRTAPMPVPVPEVAEVSVLRKLEPVT